MSDAYEDAAHDARAQMVARLRTFGISDATLNAFARVERHRLVTRFWTTPSSIGGRATQPVEYRAGDLRGLGVLHELDRAVAVNRVPAVVGGATSTASAPRLLAAQADLLALEPGTSVLEVGTGPGYFAAVLAELVGPTGRVVTIDIDGAMATSAAEALSGMGYDNVCVLVRDGHEGASDHAPFDRMVASVGCADVAAAWREQLESDGYGLVPLVHGVMHPMVRVDGRGHACVVSRSGYVGIQGRQADVSLWPYGRDIVPAEGEDALPATLAGALASPADADGFGGDAEWGLGFWLAAADQRAGHLATLNDGAGSSARIDASRGTATWGGPAGRELAGDLVRHATAWHAAGAPTMSDYRLRFVPIGAPVPEVRDVPSWTIRRVDHDEYVSLADR